MTRTFLSCFLLVVSAASAQQVAPPPSPPQPLVLLDPARGGAQAGARIADRVDEKQVTLDLAGRLAPLLRARGFAVEMTRESDVDVTGDARAALANTTRPVACILLYAVPTGTGVHLYASSVRQQYSGAGAPVRWDAAQAAFADRSHVLRDDLREAFQRAKIAASAGQTWMRPLDNMQCAAVAVEVSPKNGSTGPGNETYGGQIANVIAGVLLQWRGKAAGLAPAEPPPPPPPPPKVKPATSPAPDTSPARSEP